MSFIIIMVSMSHLKAQQPDIEWVISDSNIVNAAIDSQDKIICIKKASRGFSITKFDKNGSEIWTKHDDFNINTLKEIKVDNDDNIVVFGTERIYHHTDIIGIGQTSYIHDYYLTSFCIAKFDPDGDIIYRKKYESAISRGGIDVIAIEIDIENNIYLCAYVRDTVKIDTITIIHPLFKIYDTGGTKNPFIAKISANGNVQWVKEYRWDVEIKDMSIDQNNFYIIGDFYYSNLNIDNLFILNNLGDTDAFIVKYNYNGEPVWAKNFSSKSNDAACCLSNVRNNDILFSFQSRDTIGEYNNNPILSHEGKDIYDFSEYILNIDTLGKLIWYKPLILEDYLSDLDLFYGSSYIIISISFYEYFQYDNLVINSNGKNDDCLIKTNDSGKIIWYKHIGGINNERIIKVFTDSYDDIYFLGSFEPEIQSGNSKLTPINMICKLSGNILINDTIEFNQNQNDLFKVYPNPVRDYIYIDAPEPFIIKVCDVYGKIIKRYTFKDAGEKNIDIDDLQNGIYLLNIISDQYKRTEKIIKM